MAPRGQTTPGRRANHPSQHIPFNDRPKEIGTRTGAAMPTNVPRNSVGFEDVSAFFKSPATTEAPSSVNPSRTGASMFSGQRSGRRGLATPATIADTPAPRGRGGRMSRLAAGSDEEDGSGLGDGLLNEDDGVLDAALSSPGPWYQTNSPPTVAIPSRSRLSPQSPAVDDDSLRTPPKSGRKAAVRASPHRTRPHAQEVDMSGMDIEDNAHDEASVSQAVAPLSPTRSSSQVHRSPRKTPAGARKSAATSVGGDEVLREGEGRLSFARGKSTDRGYEEDYDQDDSGAGPSFSYNADTTGMEMDQSFDSGPGNFDASPDLGGGYDDTSVHYGNDAGLEEEEEDGDERVPLKPMKARQPTANRPRKRTERAPSEKARLAEKKRTRVSRIGVDDDEEEVKYLGDFTTRSGRKHFKPLEYWRGEKFNYGRGPGLSVIKEVVHLEDDVKRPLGAKKATNGRGRSQSSRPPPEEEGWDNETEPIGLVKEFSTGRDIQRRIAYPNNRLEPKQVQGSEFKYQKVFGEDQFIASGVVYIPVGGSKPAKPSKDNSYVFFVIQGGVQVTVHKTSFIMATGGMFMVPRGNEYEIENISQTNEAQLFFAQARKIRANETDEAALEALNDRVRSVSAALRQSIAQGDSDEE